jgi:uncharacterized protein
MLRGASSHGFVANGLPKRFWVQPDARLSVDVLFIDEAAQMSLANVVTLS